MKDGVLVKGTVSAQASTSMRSMITERQQRRWHANVDLARERLHALNTDDGNGVKFKDVEDHFVGNLDEECITAQLGGAPKIVGAASVKKHEKETGGRATMIMMKSITSVGCIGPVTCLMASKTRKSGYTDSFLVEEGAPEGSTIVMTENGFMTDNAFDELAEDFARGLRNLPVVSERPNWYFLLTADGFHAHKFTLKAQTIFAHYKIIFLIEEGDSSHCNQPLTERLRNMERVACGRYLML